MSQALRPGAGDVPRRWVVVLPVSALFVFTAITLEVLGGMNANSPVPFWADLVPLAWPAWLRVLWWLAVAAAAAGFRVSLRRAGLPTHRGADALTVLPFVAFAVGIAVGADWATWH